MLQSGTQFELGAARGSLILPTGAYHVERTDAHEPGRLRGAVGSAEAAQEAAPKTKIDIIYYFTRTRTKQIQDGHSVQQTREKDIQPKQRNKVQTGSPTQQTKVRNRLERCRYQFPRPNR